MENLTLKNNLQIKRGNFFVILLNYKRGNFYMTSKEEHACNFNQSSLSCFVKKIDVTDFFYITNSVRSHRNKKASAHFLSDIAAVDDRDPTS